MFGIFLKLPVFRIVCGLVRSQSGRERYLLAAVVLMQSRRAQLCNNCRKFIGQLGEFRAHPGRDIDHPDAFRLQADLLQQVGDVIHALFGVEVATQIVAASGQSTRDEDPVRSVFKGFQQMTNVGTSGAGDGDDLQRGRVGET